MSKPSIEETVRQFTVPLKFRTSCRVRNFSAFSKEGPVNAVIHKNGEPMKPGDTVIAGDELTVHFPENEKTPAAKRKLWEKIPIVGTWLFKRRTFVNVAFDLTEW